jgi:nucleoside-diphosphate-sugar epimerase
MKVLVSGAAGYIGRAVIDQLQAVGHHAVGMVPNDLGERTLAAAGIPAVRGDLEEDDGYQPLPPVARRYASDQETIAAAPDDVRSVVIRPSMIYGNGGSEQLPAMLRGAMRSGFSGYTAPGLNRYGNVYLDDAARAYVLALEHAQPGSAYNLAADECDFASIAEAIGALLAIPVRAFTDFEEAVSVLGAPLWAHGLACNSRVDSSKARTELGWSPQGPGLIDDLRYGSYRRVWSTRSVTVVTE